MQAASRAGSLAPADRGHPPARRVGPPRGPEARPVLARLRPHGARRSRGGAPAAARARRVGPGDRRGPRLRGPGPDRPGPGRDRARRPRARLALPRGGARPRRRPGPAQARRLLRRPVQGPVRGRRHRGRDPRGDRGPGAVPGVGAGGPGGAARERAGDVVRAARQPRARGRARGRGRRHRRAAAPLPDPRALPRHAGDDPARPGRVQRGDPARPTGRSPSRRSTVR